MTRFPSVSIFFFFNDTATTEIYTLSLHDALPISAPRIDPAAERLPARRDRLPRQAVRAGAGRALLDRAPGGIVPHGGAQSRRRRHEQRRSLRLPGAVRERWGGHSLVALGEHQPDDPRERRADRGGHHRPLPAFFQSTRSMSQSMRRSGSNSISPYPSADSTTRIRRGGRRAVSALATARATRSAGRPRCPDRRARARNRSSTRS